ncbi:MAG: acetyl-CoA carboxylase biotin carboxylase subunit [Gemmatimonadales bacterium]
MFQKVLIANRGEIALRVIRACRELGVATVAVHSEADNESLHVRFADEAVCIGPPRPTDSYLNIPRIIAAAEITGADAIHPGYGFLAENGDFAEICERSEIVFVGPTSEQIRRMGDKVAARRSMIEAGVPVVPGTEEALTDARLGRKLAEEISFPVMIKAKAGGGGKGMRIARSAAEFDGLFTMAAREAEAAFGSGDLYVEKLVEGARHVEIQVLGDRYNNTTHLGERDCSIQRRHQKLIEESPSPALTSALRSEMGAAAVRGVEAIGYVGAGTVEFLLDRDGNYYFLEMNTRIQVEHPVTEEVTGYDLVKEQLKVAAGEKLAVPDGVELRGHAIECRVNAEDPKKDFRPNPGTITTFHTPGGPGVRVDTHVYSGYAIPPYYDSLIAKLIVRGRSRDEAIARARLALEMFVIEGVETTISFLSEVLDHPDFRAGDVDTNFLERFNRKVASAGTPG